MNLLRVVAVDFLAPAAMVFGSAVVGVALGWPTWWVVIFTVVCVLVTQAVVVNGWLARRDGVTVGTDDDRPAWRTAAASLAAVALLAAVGTAYDRWTVPERERQVAIGEVVGVASDFAQAYATFDPRTPGSSVDRAADLMVEAHAETLRRDFASTATALTARGVSAQARTVSAGIEALTPDRAIVAVFLQVTQQGPAAAPRPGALALRVALEKVAADGGGGWRVSSASPLEAVAPVA